MMMSGAQILLESLGYEGVETVFGYPGGVVLPVYDKLSGSPIRHYLMRHEQNACFAAQGYARSTGKVGVCLSTSGPGATNLVTGLADAYMDSIPVVAITGQVPTAVLGSTAFQEADTVGITRPCTKHNTMVRNIRDLTPAIHEAFYIARTGRPGPVLVDIPKDVFLAQSAFEPPVRARLRGYKPNREPDYAAVAQAAAWIREAEKPVIYAGGGIVHAGASRLLRELAELTGIPVSLTVMALGCMPADHPLSLGMLGMHGKYATNMAVSNSDLLIAIGARFDDRVTGNPRAFASGARIVHIDVDPSEVSKNVPADLAVVGDAGDVLAALNEILRRTGGVADPAKREEWRARIDSWNEKHPLAYGQSDSEIKPQFLMEVLNGRLNGEAIVCADVGQHQMWAAQYLGFSEPRRWLNSGGLGSMGFGLPSAIGAAAANPHKTTVALVGDGGFQMSLPELGTLATYKIPVKVVIVNNRYLGMVRQWQELFYNRNYSEVEFPVFPDCEKLAAAYGIPGRTIRNPDALADALDEALRTPGPFILDVRVSREENVFPIVPAGKGIHEMILYEGEKQKELAGEKR